MIFIWAGLFILVIAIICYILDWVLDLREKALWGKK